MTKPTYYSDGVHGYDPTSDFEPLDSELRHCKICNEKRFCNDQELCIDHELFTAEDHTNFLLNRILKSLELRRFVWLSVFALSMLINGSLIGIAVYCILSH